MSERDRQAHEAFQAYAEAKRRVDETLDFHDAQVAADRWAAFLNLFVEPHQQIQSSNIIPFPGRGERRNGENTQHQA